jgi:hypothetical protein
MDVLNNVNTMISIVVGIFGIGGYIVGITSYLRHKAISSQQKQIARQTSSQKQPSYQIMSKRISMLDWLEAFLFGIGDCLKAWDGLGIFISLMVGGIGAAVFGGISAGVVNNFLPIILFAIPYLGMVQINVTIERLGGLRRIPQSKQPIGFRLERPSPL